MATPLYCRKCGTRLPTDGSFCPTCGASQTGTDQALTNLPQHELALIGTGRQPAGHMLHQRYRLLHTVGQGGMGAVYVAQDTQLGDRLVAVKEMSMSRSTPQDLPQAVEQFRREAHLLASLHHPNLPVIHEYFREDDRWYLVMSFIEGQNLQAALNAAPGKRLPVNDVVRIGIELCEVLEYLHTHEPEVIFRDLKPLNIMLTPKGHICLIDFGIARHFKQEQTKDTTYYYSVGYAPPEQYGQSQTGPRSDIYSLGATLHQMLSGHNPASKPFQFPLLQLVDPTIPVPLAKLIAQTLEMNEQNRPASVTEIKVQLEKILNRTPITKTMPVKSEQVERKGKDRSDKANLQQGSALTSDQISPGLWGRINNFFSKIRIVAWLIFIVLNLGCMAIGSSLIGKAFGDYFIIAGTGAAVTGLVFLLAKQRPLVDIIGGLAFIIFGILAPLVFIGPVFEQFSTYIVPVLFLNTLLLLMGIRFYLRKANTWGGVVVGGLIIAAGTIEAIPEGQPILGFIILLLLPSVIVGIAAIIVAFRKRRHNKNDMQSQRA